MRSLPVRHHGGDATLELLDDTDVPWIAELVDAFVGAVGRPWREWIESIAAIPVVGSPARRAAIVHALRRLLGGRVHHDLVSPEMRSRLLGRLALDERERATRIRAAAEQLVVSDADFEQLMWADLWDERTISLPLGRPSELAVAAAANLAIIQRCLLRCHELRLRVPDGSRSLVRGAIRRGLIASAHASGDMVEVVVSGPLALFHRTAVYGRALGSLVPALAACESFELIARCDLPPSPSPTIVRIAPPIMLPGYDARGGVRRAVEQRLAADLAKHAPQWTVVSEPPPIAVASSFAFPDLVLERDDTRWSIEIVGFWTPNYLARKLELYAAANVRVILCIDASRAADAMQLPAGAPVVPFTRRVPAARVLAIIDPTASVTGRASLPGVRTSLSASEDAGVVSGAALGADAD